VAVEAVFARKEEPFISSEAHGDFLTIHIVHNGLLLNLIKLNHHWIQKVLYIYLDRLISESSEISSLNICVLHKFINLNKNRNMLS
jgi:hypothetical protein